MPAPLPNEQKPSSKPVLAHCPDCAADLVVLRIIPGHAAEYWTMRCTRCGGIHLDIVKAAQDSGNLRA